VLRATRTVGSDSAVCGVGLWLRSWALASVFSDMAFLLPSNRPGGRHPSMPGIRSEVRGPLAPLASARVARIGNKGSGQVRGGELGDGVAAAFEPAAQPGEALLEGRAGLAPLAAEVAPQA